ncbi:MAG: DUF3817 domain-containing protein [Verrucomicrobiota bacterium]
MSQLLKTDVGRVRVSSILDGISYLVLLGIAMPLKYFADLPVAVRIVGSIHGALWILLCLALLIALLRKRLSFVWCVIVFVAALVPAAPFFLDRGLKRFDQQEQPASSDSTDRMRRN